MISRENTYSVLSRAFVKKGRKDNNSTTTFSTATLTIATHSIMDLISTLSINDEQHFVWCMQYFEYCYAEWRIFALLCSVLLGKCNYHSVAILFAIMHSVVLLNIFLMNIIVLSAFM
jgi:hypothetical protein